MVLESELQEKEQAIQKVREEAVLRLTRKGVLYKGAKLEHLNKSELREAFAYLLKDYKKLHKMYITKC